MLDGNNRNTNHRLVVDVELSDSEHLVVVEDDGMDKVTDVREARQRDPEIPGQERIYETCRRQCVIHDFYSDLSLQRTTGRK